MGCNLIVSCFHKSFPVYVSHDVCKCVPACSIADFWVCLCVCARARSRVSKQE